MAEEIRDRVFRKIVKVRALAMHGAGGEKKAAEHLLQKLKDQYGITDADIDVAEKMADIKWHRFTYSNRWMKKLLFQITFTRIRMDVDFIQGRGSFMWIGLTLPEYTRLLELYVQYKDAYAKAKEQLFFAFIRKHELMPDANAMEGLKTPPKMSMEDMHRMAKLMAGLADVVEAIPQGRQVK